MGGMEVLLYAFLALHYSGTESAPPLYLSILRSLYLTPTLPSTHLLECQAKGASR
jgi:hypothetical protein